MSEPDDEKPIGQEATVWDSTYDDPSADTVFASSDNVHIRVHSWQLKKKSGFVADMFGVATHGDFTESPLQLDAPAAIVRIFLDAMFISGTPSIHTNAEDFSTLLALCARFQSPDIEAKLLDWLDKSPVDSAFPFPFLVLAAKFDRPNLARRAAEAFSMSNRQRHTDLLDWTPKEIDEVGGSYFLALLKTYTGDRQSHNVHWLNFYTNWGSLINDLGNRKPSPSPCDHGCILSYVAAASHCYPATLLPRNTFPRVSGLERWSRDPGGTRDNTP